MTDDEILIAWAADKFDLDPAKIATVSITDEYEQGYSTVTPGYAYTEVTVYGKGGGVLASHPETEVSELIVDVCQFAASLMP